jgi:hypothetical protein
VADQTPDPQQEALFREVDEDLRHEQITRLWKQYGSTVITAAILVVAVVAGYQGWQAYEQALTKAATAPEDGAEALAQVAAQAQDGTATLALLNRAALLAQAGKTAEALSTYQQVMNSSGTDRVLRDMATLRYALLGMDNGVATGELWGLVQPLASPGQPLTYSAMQIQALLSMKDGKMEDARTTLQAMVDSAECPPGLRTRATSLLAEIAPATPVAPAAEASSSETPADAAPADAPPAEAPPAADAPAAANPS